MSDPAPMAGSGLACVCGRPLAIGIQELNRLVSGERLACPACGSDFGIDMAADKQGLEALNRFCKGVGSSSELGEIFGSQSSDAGTGGSPMTPVDVSGLDGVTPRRPGPRYAVKKPGGGMTGSGSTPGSQGTYGRRSRSPGRN